MFIEVMMALFENISIVARSLRQDRPSRGINANWMNEIKRSSEYVSLPSDNMVGLLEISCCGSLHIQL
jgi:hypothetical protein